MTMVNVPGGFFIPTYYNRLASGFALSNSVGLIDAAGEKVAVIFQVPKTGTIDRLLFRTAGVTTSQSIDVALQGVSAADGFPDGANFGGSTPGAQATLAANTMYEVTLGTSATVTLGNIVSMVLSWTSTVGSMNMAAANGTRDTNVGLPYVALFTAAWAKQADANLTSIVGVRYSDGTYAWVGGVLGGTVNTNAFNTGSIPDEIGMKYVLTAPMRCGGFWAITNPAAAATFDAILYNSSDVVQASVSVDPDQLHGTGAPKLINMRWAPVSLAIGSYRFVLKPTSANNITVAEWVVALNAQLNCNPGGANCYKTSRTDAGAWTDSDVTQSPSMGLWFDQVDDGAGAAGGMLVHPGTGGGMRG